MEEKEDMRSMEGMKEEGKEGREPGLCSPFVSYGVSEAIEAELLNCAIAIGRVVDA